MNNGRITLVAMCWASGFLWLLVGVYFAVDAFSAMSDMPSGGPRRVMLLIGLGYLLAGHTAVAICGAVAMLLAQQGEDAAAHKRLANKIERLHRDMIVLAGRGPVQPRQAEPTIAKRQAAANLSSMAGR